ncbi:hypothetical protein D3C78_1562460 [compost metagenome]
MMAIRKRSSACHRLIAEPSAFSMRRPQTCMPRVWPVCVQNLAKKANRLNSTTVASSGSRSRAPALDIASSCSLP